MKSTYPTQKTMEYLRKLGCWVKRVEHYNEYAKKRQDLWGQDIQCIQGRKLIGIQATSDENHKKRLAKAIANEEVKAWLGTGNGFEVWSWKKKGMFWEEPRVTQLWLTAEGEVRPI